MQKVYQMNYSILSKEEKEVSRPRKSTLDYIRQFAAACTAAKICDSHLILPN